MTYRPSDLSFKDCYSQPESRLNIHRCEGTGEGCPVIEESGTICGETNSLSIFQEFRQIYDECLRKLEGTRDDSGTLRKLAPFRKLVEDLWEQNTMLVETVEELEQEATCRVTNLQDKLNKSCQKICEYQEDVKSLVKIIQRFAENGEFDLTGLKFNTVSLTSINKDDQSCCSVSEFVKFKEDKSDEGSCNEDFNLDVYQPSKVMCKDEPVEDCQIDVNSQNLRYVSVKSQNKPFNDENLHRGPQSLCCEVFCTDYANLRRQRSCETVYEFEDDLCKENNCQDCVRHININLNIGNDGPLDQASHCCCECTCEIEPSDDNCC